jgi:hypothetical protein
MSSNKLRLLPSHTQELHSVASMSLSRVSTRCLGASSFRPHCEGRVRVEKNIPLAVTFDIFSVAFSVAQRTKQKLHKRIPPFFRSRSMNPDQSSKQFSRCHVSPPSPPTSHHLSQSTTTFRWSMKEQV